MSVATVAVNERLAALTEAGTAVWLDQIRRSLIEEGELQRLIEEYSLRGVTSNPAIFEKAILGSSDYDDELRGMAGEGIGPKEIYEQIAIEDVQMAADVLPPGLRRDRPTASSRSRSRPTWRTTPTRRSSRRATTGSGVDRPNVMIKIPGTTEGLPAIEQAIYEGINVNVTLLFSVESYEKVAEAYIRGLERRLEEGKSARGPLGGELLRLARGHRGGQAARGARAQGAPGHGGGAERARGVRALQGDLRGRPLREAARRGRARAAPAVGLDRREEPALRGDQVRRRARRAAHGEHDADAHAARGRGEGRGGGRHRRRARGGGRAGPEGARATPASTSRT